MAMSWQYIAGFFDGEGCIRLANEGKGGIGSIQISLHQSANRGLYLLLDIKKFLETNGIVNIGIQTQKKCSQLTKKPMHRLYIYNRVSACIFIRNVLPYIHIKKVECQDILRYMIMWPHIKGNHMFATPYVPRTHCSNGHELTPENVYEGKRNARICRICIKAAANARYKRICETARGLREALPVR